jgi:hypothetical protein
MTKIYALYKGEDFLAVGTLDEIADELNIKKSTLHHYKSPAYLEIVEMSDNNNWRVLHLIEEEKNEKESKY